MHHPPSLARHLGGPNDHDHSHPHPRGGAAPEDYAPPLVELTRGGLSESLHRGAIVVCTPDGNRIKGVGHPAMLTFLRSAAKPLQALPVVESGAHERYGFTPAELACMCGSLNGEDFQVEAVRSILGKAGLSEELLDCGVHPPNYRPTAQALAQRGEKPKPVHNNCAGKHAAMLALCAHLGFPFKNYIALNHPVQQLILHAVAETCSYPAEQIGIGIDGCGVPVFRLPLFSLAGAYARLAAPAEAGLRPELARAAETLLAASLAHPEMIAGTGRICTRLMQAAPGSFLAKTGSEGSYAVALPGLKLGMAINIEDGGMRALGPAVSEALHQLGVLDHAALEGPLADLNRTQIKNHRGEVVSELAAVFSLA